MLFFVGLSAVFLLDVAFLVVLRKGAFNARVLAVIAGAGITYEFMLVTQRVSLEGQIIGIAMLVPMFAYLYGMFIWGRRKAKCVVSASCHLSEIDAVEVAAEARQLAI